MAFAYLLAFRCRGMIYIGLKKFPKALELLHNVRPLCQFPVRFGLCPGAYCSVFQAVTAPMSSLNAIAVEAYKKYILVSLIQNGQVCFHSAFSTAVHVNAEPEDTLFLVNSPDDQL